MRAIRHQGTFSLPILLSFNELAWILIFWLGLFSAHTLMRMRKADPTLLAGLTNAVAEARAQIAVLTHEREMARATIKELTNGLTELSEQVQTLTSRQHARDEEIRQSATDLARARTNVDSLMRETNRLRANLQEAEKKLVAYQRERNFELERAVAQLTGSTNRSHPTAFGEAGIRQELLGLKGCMTNVCILLDRSGSMSIGDRWKDALSVVGAWLCYLPIQRCVLITFNDHYIAYPAAGLFTAVGKEGATNRVSLIKRLRELMPNGNTDTLSALKRAYSYAGEDKADTIILFTDGAPYVPPPSTSRSVTSEAGRRIRYSKEQMEAVLVLARSHPDVPVNVVAIGNYYEEGELTKFLLKLAEQTGGVFLGR